MSESTLRPCDYNGYTSCSPRRHSPRQVIAGIRALLREAKLYEDETQRFAQESPEPAPPEDDPAARALAVTLETRELVYQLAETLGISRDELNERAGITP